MTTMRDHRRGAGRQGRARHRLGFVTGLGRDAGDMEKGCNMDQERREDHGRHWVEEDGRRLCLRDQAQRRELPLNLAKTQCDCGHRCGKTPADQVKEPVLLGKPSRVPNSVQMEVDNQGRAPGARGYGREDKQGTCRKQTVSNNKHDC